MSKHTKGPWSVTDNSWEVSSVYDAAGDLVAQCRIHDSVTEDNQDELEPIKEANARLIAAAPDLLHALKEAVEFANKANNYIAGQDLPASAEWLAAIAKAEGRDNG